MNGLNEILKRGEERSRKIREDMNDRESNSQLSHYDCQKRAERTMRAVRLARNEGEQTMTTDNELVSLLFRDLPDSLNGGTNRDDVVSATIALMESAERSQSMSMREFCDSNVTVERERALVVVYLMFKHMGLTDLATAFELATRCPTNPSDLIGLD